MANKQCSNCTRIWDETKCVLTPQNKVWCISCVHLFGSLSFRISVLRAKANGSADATSADAGDNFRDLVKLSGLQQVP